MRIYPLALAAIGIVFAVAVPCVAVHQAVLAWVMSAALLLAFMLISGYAITGRWLGMLIDDRNVVSLSRFQMALWTILILSAFFAAAMLNIAASTQNPLAIAVDPSLWALMGISTTSLVGSPLILSTKAAPGNVPAQELVLADGSAARGSLAVNRDIAQAKWSDMFTGEEVGNWRHLDLSRIQMFFFTVVTAIAYGAQIVHVLGALHGLTVVTDGTHEPNVVPLLPMLDPSLVALIGISHGGYLVSKAVPSTSTAGQSGTGPKTAVGSTAPDQVVDEPAMG